MLAQGERTRVLRIGTDREGRGLARLAVARRERLGVMAGVIGWLLVWTEAKVAESPSQVDSKDSQARKLASSPSSAWLAWGNTGFAGIEPPDFEKSGSPSCN